MVGMMVRIEDVRQVPTLVIQRIEDRLHLGRIHCRGDSGLRIVQQKTVVIPQAGEHVYFDGLHGMLLDVRHTPACVRGGFPGTVIVQCVAARARRIEHAGNHPARRIDKGLSGSGHGPGHCRIDRTGSGQVRCRRAHRRRVARSDRRKSLPTPRSRSFTRTSTEGLEVLRHDAAHVMAEAVKELYPETQVTIGPAIEDGFLLRFRARASVHPRGSRAHRSADA